MMIPCVTRTSIPGVAPIHFPPRSRFLPIPGRLRAHTHAIPILVDRTLPLPLLVVLSMTMFPLALYYIRSLDSRLVSLALPILPVPTLLYPEPYTLLSVHDVITLYLYRTPGR
jgi:hypothetical protein